MMGDVCFGFVLEVGCELLVHFFSPVLVGLRFASIIILRVRVKFSGRTGLSSREDIIASTLPPKQGENETCSTASCTRHLAIEDLQTNPPQSGDGNAAIPSSTQHSKHSYYNQ